MNKLAYNSEGTKRLTDCPFDKDKPFGMKVASTGCQQCQYFKGENCISKIVYCSCKEMFER